MAETETTVKPLVATDVKTLQKTEAPTDIAGIQVNFDDPVMNKRADEFLTKLMDAKDPEVQREAIDNIGVETQKNASRSEMLKGQIRVLANKGADGGTVANALLDLKNTVESLDPNKFDLENSKNFIIRSLSWIPIVGNPLKKYFEKYMTAQEVIDAIIKSLEIGRESLVRDNKILSADQKRMRIYAKRLMEIIGFMQILDKKLEDKAFELEVTDADAAKFVREELLYAHRQRILGMQKTLAANQLAILVIEVIIRNNGELIRGVDEALRVTIQALETAVALSFALTHQRIVLDKITALTGTTETLMADTAKKLKTQGVEIHKKSSSAGMSIAVLKQTFADIHEAFADISKFRIEALPKMAQDISTMDMLSADAEKTIQKMEKGTQATARLSVDFDGEEFKVGA